MWCLSWFTFSTMMSSGDTAVLTLCNCMMLQADSEPGCYRFSDRLRFSGHEHHTAAAETGNNYKKENVQMSSSPSTRSSRLLSFDLGCLHRYVLHNHISAAEFRQNVTDNFFDKTSLWLSWFHGWLLYTREMLVSNIS